jgi:hypothetical protein
MLPCIAGITPGAGKIALAEAPSRAKPGLRPRRGVMAFDFPGLRKPPAATDISPALALGDLLLQRLQFVSKALGPAGDKWFPVSRA